MTNKYYILPLPPDNSQVWDIVVEDESTVRKNLQGNKMIVKLYEDDEVSHPILNGRQEYNHEEILQYLADNTEDWNEVEL